MHEFLVMTAEIYIWHLPDSQTKRRIFEVIHKVHDQPRKRGKAKSFRRWTILRWFLLKCFFFWCFFFLAAFRRKKLGVFDVQKSKRKQNWRQHTHKMVWLSTSDKWTSDGFHFVITQTIFILIKKRRQNDIMDLLVYFSIFPFKSFWTASSVLLCVAFVCHHFDDEFIWSFFLSSLQFTYNCNARTIGHFNEK